MVKVAINGLGRIGRGVFRQIFEKNNPEIELVVVNGPANIKIHQQLLMFDSVHGKFLHDITIAENDYLQVNNQKVKLLQEKNIQNINWNDFDVDIVFECTGKFLTQELLQQHLQSGAKKVILSAPAKDDIKTIIYGINQTQLNENDNIVSIGSCTTNCLAHMVYILHKEFEVATGFATTVHSYTADQNIVDASHKDPRRARAASLSMIPTSTGAAKMIGKIIPELQGKLQGVAIRVPTPNVSLVDLSLVLQKNATRKQINRLFKQKAEENMKNILLYDEKPLVSIDYNHTEFSCIYDANSLYVMDGGNLIRLAGWYDNEWGFITRMIDVAKYLKIFL